MDLFSILAGIASILGLIVSIPGLGFAYKAWKSATRAKEAAAQARQAIRMSNASEDFQRLSRMARELLDSAQGGRFDGARMRSADLVEGMGQASERWRATLGDSERMSIEAAAKEVRKISRALVADDVGIPPEAREKLLKSCHTLIEVLARISGASMERAEGGGVNG